LAAGLIKECSCEHPTTGRFKREYLSLTENGLYSRAERINIQTHPESQKCSGVPLGFQSERSRAGSRLPSAILNSASQTVKRSSTPYELDFSTKHLSYQIFRRIMNLDFMDKCREGLQFVAELHSEFFEMDNQLLLPSCSNTTSSIPSATNAASHPGDWLAYCLNSV
jgi:hypothetical protein